MLMKPKTEHMNSIASPVHPTSGSRMVKATDTRAPTMKMMPKVKRTLAVLIVSFNCIQQSHQRDTREKKVAVSEVDAGDRLEGKFGFVK